MRVARGRRTRSICAPSRGLDRTVGGVDEHGNVRER